MIQTLAGLIAKLLLPEIQLLRTDLQQINQSLAAIAVALDYRNVQDFGSPISPSAPAQPVEVTYVNDSYQAEIMDIELRLTMASGAPPTEEEILLEYERRRVADGDQPHAPQ